MTPEIRLRASLAVVQQDRILLVPHFDTNTSPIQWVIPNGRVEFGEHLHVAALREFREVTGMKARVVDLLDTCEVILEEPPYHSITVTFLGEVEGGAPTFESDQADEKITARWLSLQECQEAHCHPHNTVMKALLRH